MSNNTINDLFNPTGAVETEQKNTDVYKVSFKDGANKIYTSVIRFIPWHANPSKNIMKKYTSWVKNPMTQKGMYVDDPREIGQPSPVVDLFFELKNTKIPTYEDYAKNYLSSKLNYSALVQIINDPQHPNLNGQIKVFTFGKTIWEKLHQEEFPVVPGQVGINPFDPFRGRYFSIYCTEKSGYNNFDNSQFFDNKDVNGNTLPSGIWYVNPETGQMEYAQDGMNRQYLVDYLVKNSPDLSKYDFQPWNDSQTQHVNEVCTMIRNFMSTGRLESPNTSVQQNAMNVLQTPTQQPVVFPGASYQPTPAPAAQPSPVPNPPMGGFAPMPQVPATPAAPMAQAPAAPVAPAAPAVPMTPAAPSAPMAQAPAAPVQPQSPVGGFVPTPPPAAPTATTTVTPPQVTPAAQAAQPVVNTAAAGINMDDILNQL